MGIMVNVPEGYVALQHYNSNGWAVKAGDTVYTFVPKHNVSIAFVKEEHVDSLLQIRTKACCGKDRNRFFRASQINVNLWATGDRHGEINA